MITVSAGLLVAFTAGAALATGVLSTTSTTSSPRHEVHQSIAPAPARPRALTAFSSCEALRTWYVSHNLRDVASGGWTYGGWVSGPLDGRTISQTKGLDNLAAAYPGRILMQSGSATGTNTQEANVDEPDIAKTNGHLLARIVDDNKLVLVDVSGSKPRVTRRLRLPTNGYNNQLLLVGDHVLVTQQTDRQPIAETTNTRRGLKIVGYYGGATATRMFDVNISDPTHPRVVSIDRFSGTLLAARQYGDTIRLITSTQRPNLRWVFPTKHRSWKQATLINRTLLRRTRISDWLPSVIRDGRRTSLADCSGVLHPDGFSGSATTAVITFNLDHTDQRHSVAITAAGGIVYSSADRLEITSTLYDRYNDRIYNGPRDAQVAGNTTWIHSFALTSAAASYLGSGHVPGTLRDRRSLDEYDGHLRAAWTRVGPRGHPHNGLSILAESDGALRPTATLTNLGGNEDLQSVRWFDNLAILVTFRQIDPLFTIDLSNADHPRVLGVLRIPGYSGYLHPISDHLVLGLGTNVAHGETYGAQAAVFDIRNLLRPVRISKVSFGPYTQLPAVDDPLEFTWDSTNSNALTPLTSWSSGGARMLSLHVSAAGRVSQKVLVHLNDGWMARTFALPDGTVAILDGHRVRVVAG